MTKAEHCACDIAANYIALARLEMIRAFNTDDSKIFEIITEMIKCENDLYHLDAFGS